MYHIYPGWHSYHECIFVCRYLDLGSYAEWDEDKRLEFLTRELEGKRPLIPPAMPMTNDVKEVLPCSNAALHTGLRNLWLRGSMSLCLLGSVRLTHDQELPTSACASAGHACRRPMTLAPLRV